VIRQLLADEEAQDLIEYVLLGATMALAGLAAYNRLDDIIRIVYTNWDAATQALWEPQNPQP
jgi:hypothetical protein